eukprot:IDg15017t1
MKIVRGVVVAEANPEITVRGPHLHRHFRRCREQPSFSQQLHDALKFHRTDEVIIAAEEPFREREIA